MAEKINPGFSRANHVGITVRNLEKSIAFYEALTGLKVSNVDEIGGPRMAKTQGLEDTRIKFANLHLDNLNIDILEYVLPAPEKAAYHNNQISAMHLCFEVDDIDAAMERLKQIGVVPEGAPIVFEEADGLRAGFGTAVAYFTDPDGTNLEIIAPKGPFKRKNP
ncbi:VOC family protein [Chitinophaga sp. Cy-1792]|uniref:VOC family protein n=1 Tax=Chitinophaga sp. Cy-1792 TaxID=2608339 RepID=UPI00142078AA|nr:VOC family protein [Chitinophaga sp. Cy-1792]NIG55016.1 VOC family protein [Chitinophaga sp. Cy-1792]